MPRPFYNSIEKYIAMTGVTDFSPKGIRKIVSAIRDEKLPDPKERASSGSFFKNVYLDEKGYAAAETKGYPVYHGHDGYKINSGWLIEKAVCRGFPKPRLCPPKATATSLPLAKKSSTKFTKILATNSSKSQWRSYENLKR